MPALNKMLWWAVRAYIVFIKEAKIKNAIDRTKSHLDISFNLSFELLLSYELLDI
jgi:hypothetical protein